MKILRSLPAQPILISLLLHVCFYLLALLTPSPSQYRPQEIEVVYQNETPEGGQQIVTNPEQEELKKALAELKDRAKRLSEHTRRFEKEQLAQQTGPTRNRNNKPVLPNDDRPQDFSPRREAPKQAPEIGAHGDLAVSPLPLPGAAAREMRTGYSALAEFVPDVQEGGFTALNTDQFIHYTFYARTNEQIRNRWVAMIRQFVRQNLPTEINRLAQKTQITEVEIILTPEGEFKKAILHQGAESRDLDEIAVTAFRLAAPFNNPPSEMVKEDGFIHLHYGFHVQFRPRMMAGGNRAPQ